MARNRQRAKQRQAARRERQGRQEPSGDGARRAREKPVADAPTDGKADEPVLNPRLEAEAPPEDLGRADGAVEAEPDLDDEDHLEEEEVDEALEAEAEALAMEGKEPDDEAYAPRGRRGADALPTETKGRGRFLQILVAVRAELRRVQWPDRKALTTLTGVVLGFVLIAGGYLGLLDAIFSRIIQAIL
jgi:preprotein translocase subunit SecE